MEKFLKKYYKQLHFNSMPAAVRTRFFDWVRQDSLTDDMRNWVRDCLQHQPAPHEDQLVVDADGNYVPNALPDTRTTSTDLSDADARALFVAFQKAFANMHAARNSFKDKDKQSDDFVTHYFGPDKLFQTPPASTDCATGIEKIVELLQNQNKLQKYILDNTKNDEGKPLFDSTAKVTDLIQKCKNKEYNSDASVQNQIQAVAKTLADAVGWYSSIDKDSAEYQAIKEIEDKIGNVLDDNAFAPDPRSIPDTDLRDFRNIFAPHEKTGLLQTLYFNKTIRDRFAKYDHGVITGPINKAEESVNWQDKTKDNYVDPKMSDVLTPLQQVEQWVADTYGNTIKKYEELRGAPLFDSQEAKDIFAAIDKAKIKPVDGLDGLLKKKGDIEGKINNPVARQHFKWFTETIEPIASKMPKAIEGAWRNPEQMKGVITEIILKATDPTNSDPHAIEKAKTAMQIMTAMKYGLLTSKIMDAMKQTDFSLFSDGKLSWNKNEGIQFVTSAFDKGIKAAFLTIGYAATFAVNKIQLSRMEFKNQDNRNNDPLSERFNQENAKQNDLRVRNAADQRSIVNRQRLLATLNSGSNPLNDTTLDAHEIQRDAYKTQRDTHKREMENQSTIMETNRDGYNNYTAAQTTIDQDTKKHTKLDGLRNQLNDPTNGLNIKIANKEAQLNNSATYAGMPAPAANALAMQLQQELAELKRQQQETQQQYDDLDASLHESSYLTALANANTAKTANQAAFDAYNNADSAYHTAETNYNNANAAYNESDNKIKQFNDAKRQIRELQQAIDDRNAALRNWPQSNMNKVLELENYWNWLQSGDTKSWRLSRKNAQEQFDQNKLAMLARYSNQYGLAA